MSQEAGLRYTPNSRTKIEASLAMVGTRTLAIRRTKAVGIAVRFGVNLG